MRLPGGLSFSLDHYRLHTTESEINVQRSYEIQHLGSAQPLGEIVDAEFRGHGHPSLSFCDESDRRTAQTVSGMRVPAATPTVSDYTDD